MNALELVLWVLCISVAAAVAQSAPPVRAMTGPATAARTKQDERAALAGEWRGNAAIIVNWTRQKSLALHLYIDADGKVSGTVGDAKLTDGTFVSNALGSREFRVHGRLAGNLLDDEQIRRYAVDILFNVTEDGSLVGGLHSSGSKIGGKKSMKLSATKMVLRRETPVDK